MEMVAMTLRQVPTLLATLTVGLAACASQPADEAPAVAEAEAAAERDDDGDGDDHGGHEHTAPHGGALAELGDHYAQLEAVIDPDTGRLTLYVLDGEAERPFRTHQPGVTAELITDGEPFLVELEAVANVLTGERVGDSSEFRATAPGLVGASHASIRVETITVRGQTFDNVRLRWQR